MENRKDSALDWEERKSSNGKTYEIGRPKGDAATNEAAAEGHAMAKEDFGLQVNWPVGSVGSIDWIDTSDEVKQIAGITRYALVETDDSYKYRLYFSNTENYNYYFYDGTGDGYQVNTYRNGNHDVRYNSNNPGILFITGS